MKNMTKSTKIILCVIAATLVLCAVIIAVSAGVRGKKQPSSTTFDTSAYAQTTTESFFDLEGGTEAAPQTAASSSLAQQLLGKWTDSAGMSGYEFFEGGKVTVTYFNLTVPILNLPLSGTADGSYTLNGDTLSVSFSIYTKAINYTYSARIENNQLKLTNREDGKTSVYMRGTPEMASEIPESPAVDDQLTGTWGSSDATMRYQFDGNGIVTMAFAKAELPQVSRKAISGSYTGVYMTQGGSLTIQFLMDGERATQTYTYTVNARTLSLTDNKANTVLFLRDGVSALPAETASPESLLGKWRDATGARGYTFLEGGTAEITYVDINIPVINIPINGSFRGTYEIDGNRLTLRYSLYIRSVTETFTYEVSGNALTLTNTETGEVSSYSRS